MVIAATIAGGVVVGYVLAHYLKPSLVLRLGQKSKLQCKKRTKNNF